ncbi:MAG: class I SAM-dependent methyltransferase [Campylobacteraceae bacterium]|nr:class I SAM-dependent methyltransferase [Campylobacteraceae bacterium]
MKYNTNQTLKRIERLFAEQDKKLQDIKTEVLSQIRYIEKLNFAQNESFYWLAKRLKLENALPHTRGWPMSPDILLKLHEYIMSAKPKKIVEFGSGVSTVIICDALCQNGEGLLYSIDHLEEFGAQTLQNIKKESLEKFIDLRIAPLEPWGDEHIYKSEKPAFWYQKKCIEDIQDVDLLIVDGPPGNTCPFARYPALPAFYDRLDSNAQVWIDDTNRDEEKEICKVWTNKYNMSIKYFPLEKGLSILIKR